jgi:hypothetical protein
MTDKTVNSPFTIVIAGLIYTIYGRQSFIEFWTKIVLGPIDEEKILEDAIYIEEEYNIIMSNLKEYKDELPEEPYRIFTSCIDICRAYLEGTKRVGKLSVDDYILFIKKLFTDEYPEELKDEYEDMYRNIYMEYIITSDEIYSNETKNITHEEILNIDEKPTFTYVGGKGIPIGEMINGRGTDVDTLIKHYPLLKDKIKSCIKYIEDGNKRFANKLRIEIRNSIRREINMTPIQYTIGTYTKVTNPKTNNNRQSMIIIILYL